MDLTPEIAGRLEIAAARLKAATDSESPLEPPPGTPAAARLAPDSHGEPLANARLQLRRARARLEELEAALAELWTNSDADLTAAASGLRAARGR